MRISEIRIYAEVLEQGLDIKDYIREIDKEVIIKNIYTKKSGGFPLDEDSIITRIRKTKDFDILVTIIDNTSEYPLLVVEYSASVPTDDHKMQRSDVYFWGAIYNVPVIKIYADLKGMNQKFGGGDRITEKVEQSIAHSRKGTLHLIPWELEEGKETLQINELRFSCIKNNISLGKLINDHIKIYKSIDEYNKYFKASLDYFTSNTDFETITPVDILPNSTRFNWNKELLTVKINRFGHAMDPDRGVLFFANMLVGIENLNTEIQIERTSLKDRGGYKALFDGISKERILTELVTDIFENKNNNIDSETAIDIFLNALNLESILKINHLEANKFYITDINLESFFKTSRSMTANSIFLLTHKLILTNSKREVICSIEWNPRVSENYLDNFHAENYKITELKSFSFAEAKEDIITFATVELFKKIEAELISVSYPGAQGDRAVLTGEGRRVKRIYIDVIASQMIEDKIYVYIQENKEKFSSIKTDIIKLNEIKTNTEKLKGLNNLILKTNNIEHIDSLYLGVGAKYNNIQLPNLNDLSDIDYIFMFDFESTDKETLINWQVAVIDTTLINNFKLLINSEKKLKGQIKLDTIYTIK